MGDYSRDTFGLTNVMHEVVTGETVTDPRHYIGVRMQQAVPLIDSDWNDAHDIHRREMEILIRNFIGDGVPGLGQGFAIAPVEVDNDFAIQPGLLIVSGWQVINPALLLYSDLSRFEGGSTDLNSPSGNRFDIVYLDTYEIETTASGNSSDERLVNNAIGIETTARLERVWTIRVAENASDFSALTLNEPGHKYYPLARLHRTTSARIQAYMIEDLRRLGLTLTDGIKAPMYVSRGGELLDPARFSAMLHLTREVIRYWQENGLFPIVLVSASSWLAYQNAVNEIFNIAAAAEVNSDTFNLDNNGGLSIMQKLVDAQQLLLSVIRTYPGSDLSIVDLYEDYLDGDPGVIDGIQSALDNQDLLGAVQGQEELLDFLGLSMGDLPTGNITVVMESVVPATPLTTATFTITYSVASGLTTPSTPEVFDLTTDVSDTRWAASLNVSQITLAPGGSGSVTMTVDPNDTLVNGDSADITLIARPHRRPSISSSLPRQTFTIGELPPGETFIFYSGNTATGVHDLVDGAIVIPRTEISGAPFGYIVIFVLVNTTGGGAGGELQTFDITYELIWPEAAELPAGVVPVDWLPNAPETIPSNDVAGGSAAVDISYLIPDISSVVADIEFNLSVTATLVAVDGVPIVGGKTTTVEQPIIIQAP